MGKMQRYIYIDSEVIQEIVGEISPFNIVSDFKHCLGNQIKWFFDEIDNNLQIDLYKTISLKRSKKGDFSCRAVKIRVANPKANSGTSGGYRCILLLNDKNNEAIPLHIYNKSKKKDITQNEKNKLIKLLDLFVKSIDD